MNQYEQARVFRSVDAMVSKRHSAVAPNAACFYYAVHGALAIRQRGVRAVVQAGSLSWPCVPPEQDDGVSATHFSYIWTPPDTDDVVQLAVAGRLPEMHCWVGLPATDTIVDFSTQHLTAQAARLNVVWRGDQPPPYLWASKLPRGVHYVAEPAAIELVLRLAVMEFGIPTVKKLVQP